METVSVPRDLLIGIRCDLLLAALELRDRGDSHLSGMLRRDRERLMEYVPHSSPTP